MTPRPIFLLLSAAVLLTGCGRKSAAGGPPPGMKVAVRAAQVVRQPVAEKLALVASISPNERVEIKSPVEGTIARIHFAEGERVEQGRVLFELDTDKWDAFLGEAEAAYKVGEANRARAEAMLGNQTISRQEYDTTVAQFEAAKATLARMKKQLEDARIAADFAGVVGARAVSIGQVVSPQTILTTVVDMDPVKVEFNVPERFLAQLKIGQSIAFRVAAYPGTDFAGEVYFIAPEVDATTRSVPIKARAANADGRLRPGMFGNLDLILSVREDALVVPEAALVPQGDALLVFIVDEQGLAQPRPVKVGVRLAGAAEIIEGLAEGETVIVDGLQKVRPGVPVAPRPRDGSP